MGTIRVKTHHGTIVIPKTGWTIGIGCRGQQRSSSSQEKLVHDTISFVWVRSLVRRTITVRLASLSWFDLYPLVAQTGMNRLSKHAKILLPKDNSRLAASDNPADHRSSQMPASSLWTPVAMEATGEAFLDPEPPACEPAVSPGGDGDGK
jgi:hypothetical protein